MHHDAMTWDYLEHIILELRIPQELIDHIDYLYRLGDHEQIQVIVNTHASDWQASGCRIIEAATIEFAPPVAADSWAVDAAFKISSGLNVDLPPAALMQLARLVEHAVEDRISAIAQAYNKSFERADEYLDQPPPDSPTDDDDDEEAA